MKLAKTSSDIPYFVQPFLWSYDLDQLDIKRDQRLIIFQVLSVGSREATDWLRGQYSREQIQEVIVQTPISQWNQKSLALWSLVFDVIPSKKTRFS